LTVKGLEQGRWAEATVDMTQARRPDGTGGQLSEDERIDDIQFYVDPAAELLIDDIVLYDASEENAAIKKPAGTEAGKEGRPFPKQIVFTAWFDTGKQGAEWPGDFEIVPHRPPLTWKAARAVAAAGGKSQWIRVDLRGARPVTSQVRLRFRSFLKGSKMRSVEVGLEGIDRRATLDLGSGREGAWLEYDVGLGLAMFPLLPGATGEPIAMVRDVVFRTAAGAELLIDDVLLYEPGDKPHQPNPASK
jgi:hypothetical protein